MTKAKRRRRPRSKVLDYIERHMDDMDDEELGWQLGRTAKQIRVIREWNGLSRQKNWTDEDRERLAELWPVAELELIREAFPDATEKAIRNQAHMMGLKRFSKNKRISIRNTLKEEKL